MLLCLRQRLRAAHSARASQHPGRSSKQQAGAERLAATKPSRRAEGAKAAAAARAPQASRGDFSAASVPHSAILPQAYRGGGRRVRRRGLRVRGRSSAPRARSAATGRAHGIWACVARCGVVRAGPGAPAARGRVGGRCAPRCGAAGDASARCGVFGACTAQRVTLRSSRQAAATQASTAQKRTPQHAPARWRSCCAPPRPTTGERRCARGRRRRSSAGRKCRRLSRRKRTCQVPADMNRRQARARGRQARTRGAARGAGRVAERGATESEHARNQDMRPPEASSRAAAPRKRGAAAVKSASRPAAARAAASGAPASGSGAVCRFSDRGGVLQPLLRSRRGARACRSADQSTGRRRRGSAKAAAAQQPCCAASGHAVANAARLRRTQRYPQQHDAGACCARGARCCQQLQAQ